MEESGNYPEGPEEFGEHSWPHPRLVDNGNGRWVPQGKDEALVWYMDYFRDDINMRGPRRGKKSILVKVKAAFRCHTKKCGQRWQSSHAWISFDMRQQKVKKMFGQRCRKCKGFYSNPMPFFFTEAHPDWDETEPWRNIVVKAIDLWCKPDPPEDNFEEDASGWGSGDEEGAVEGALERPSSRPSGGPHPEWLCEMCKMKRWPCWDNKNKSRNRNDLYHTLSG